MPFDRVPARRPAGIVVTMTGHPPPLQQVANQVRTSTGYTLGIAGADGPRLHPASPRDQRAAAVRLAELRREQEAKDAARQLDDRDCADVHAWLCERERQPLPVGGQRGVRPIPLLINAAEDVGYGWTLARLRRALMRLQETGELSMVTAGKGRRGAAIRLAGSAITLITTDFSADVGLP